MARYEGQMGSSLSSNPLIPAAGGFAGGVALDRAAMALQSAQKRATWGLALAVGLGALFLVNSGNLNTQVTQAQSIAATLNAFNVTATGSAAGTDVGFLRGQMVAICNALAMTAYYASPFNWFSTQPTQYPIGGAAIGTVTSTVVQSNSNSNTAALLFVAVGVGIVALA